jgi:cobalamin biosynthesis protein CbiD
MKFIVTITETRGRTIEVEAETAADAESEALDQVRSSSGNDLDVIECHANAEPAP